MDMAWEDPSRNYGVQKNPEKFDSPDKFDLIEYQDKARDMYSPRRLFELWEDVCKKYDRGVIRSYDLDEMKAVILPKLHMLAQSRFFAS
jgi:hypothetical protein